MIFNAKKISSLIEEWNTETSDEILDEITNECIPLAEVIATKFSDDSNYRDDLIQECLMRIPLAIRNFDPTIANSHSYFTSVFRNRCISYIAKETKNNNLSLMLIDIDIDSLLDLSTHDMLADLVERNRKRFISLPIYIIDEMTHTIFQKLLSGSKPGSGRGIIKESSEKHNVNRTVVRIVYHSSIAYLRMKYDAFALDDFLEPTENSLLPELKNLIGTEGYRRILLVFAGMNLRIPQ